MKGILIAFIEMYHHGRADRLEKSRLRVALNDKLLQNEELIGDLIRERRRAELLVNKNEDLHQQQVGLDREILSTKELSDSRERMIAQYIPEIQDLLLQRGELQTQVMGLIDTVARQKTALAMQKKLIAEYRSIGKKTRR